MGPLDRNLDLYNQNVENTASLQRGPGDVENTAHVVRGALGPAHLTIAIPLAWGGGEAVSHTNASRPLNPLTSCRWRRMCSVPR